MVNKIRFTDYAKDELRLIFEYYRLKVNYKTAVKIKQNIISSIKRLEKNSFMFQIEENLVAIKKDYRRIVEGNYKIIYRVENEVIYITDIFDKRRNPDIMKAE